MCWYSEKLEIKYAENDIKVFKVVKYRQLSHLGNKTYEIVPFYYYLNEVYGYYKNECFGISKELFEQELDFSVEKAETYGYYISGNSFHSYSDKNLQYSQVTEKCYYVRNCFLTVLDFYELNDGILIMHCIIPKGAKYAVNELGEYVSDKLKIKSFEKIK